MAAAVRNHWEGVFVGREKELDELIRAWNDGRRTFGIYGLRSVGKTRLVNELLRRLGLSDDSVYRLDYSGITTLNEMIQETKRGLNLTGDLQEKTWTQDIASELGKRVKDSSKDLVVFIKHYEDIDKVKELKNDFNNLCEKLATVRCIRLIFTSTMKIRFAKLQKLWKPLDLCKKLSYEESKTILDDLLQADCSVVLGQHETRIIEFCEGLPYPLMIVANELKEDSKMLTPKDMVLLLQLARMDSLSREHYPEHERMKNLIGDPISKLHNALREQLVALELLKGSFDKKTGAAAVGANNTAVFMDQVIIPATRSCLIQFDPKSENFNSTGFQREYVANEVHIGEERSEDAKARLAQIYDGRLRRFLVLPDVIPETMVHSREEQTSFRGIARIALNSSKVFPNYIQTLVETNYFCCRDLHNECIDVSEVILAQCASARQDGAFEEGISLSLLAKLIIEQTGDAIESLQVLEEKAAEAMVNQGSDIRSRELAELYEAIGIRYVVCGNKEKALENLNKSNNLLVKLGFTEEDFLFAKSLNLMGFTSALSGQWLEALNYMLESVQLRVRMLGETHIAVAIQSHNIGLLFRQMKDSSSNYTPFKLEKDYSVPSNFYTMCLHGFAEQFLRMKQPERAIKVAEEGIRISAKNGKVDKGVTLPFHDVMTNAYISANRFDEAESCLKTMLNQQLDPHWLTSVLNRCGFVLRQLGMLQEAEKNLREAFKHKHVIADPMSRLYFETCHELALVYTFSRTCNGLERVVYYDKLAVDELHRLGDEYFRVGNAKQLRCITDDIHQIIDNARQRGFEVPFPQCCQDQHGACFLRIVSNSGHMVYADHDADDLERQIISVMANEQNGQSENFCPRTSASSPSSHGYGGICQSSSNGMTRSHLNESSPGSARIPRQLERQERPESDFLSSGSHSSSSSRSSNCFNQSVGQQCRLVPGCDRPQEYPASSRIVHQGNVHLGNHNNPPHPQVTYQSNEVDERWGSSMGIQGGFNDQTYKWHPSRSDSSQSQKIWSSSYPTLNGRPTTADGSQTLSPVESSWPSDSHNHFNSDCCQFVPNGSLALSQGSMPYLPGQQGIVRSLGIHPSQKVGENEFLVHDHVRPNSRGELEPHISLLGGDSRQQIPEGSSNAQSQGQSLQYISSLSSQTFPKECVSTEFCNCVNSDSWNIPPKNLLESQQKSAAAQCRYASPPRQQRTNPGEFERRQDKAVTKMPNAQISPHFQNRSQDLGIEISPCTSDSSRPQCTEAHASGVQPGPNSPSCHDTIQLQSRHGFQQQMITADHVPFNPMHNLEQFTRQEHGSQNLMLNSSAFHRLGPSTQLQGVPSDSESGTSPISVSQSYKGFISPPGDPTAQQYEYFNPLQHNEGSRCLDANSDCGQFVPNGSLTLSQGYLPYLPGQQGIVRSLGIHPSQKVGENEFLVHDHVRPNSRGELEPHISLLGGDSRQQIPEGSSNAQSQGQSLQYISSLSSQTFPKECVSTEFRNCVNSDSRNIPPKNLLESQQKSAAAQCRYASPPRQQRTNPGEFERRQDKAVTKLPNAQISPHFQNRSQDLYIEISPCTSDSSRPQCTEADASGVQPGPNSPSCHDTIQLQSRHGFQQQMITADHAPFNPKHNLEQFTRQEHGSQNLMLNSSAFHRLGPSTQLQGVPSDSESCTSPISVSQSYKGFISPPLQHNEGRRCLDATRGFNQGQSNYMVRPQPHGNMPSHPGLFYPPTTSWHPTASQIGASSLESYQERFNTACTQEGYVQHTLRQDSRLLNQTARAPSDTNKASHPMSSYGPQEILFAATSAESQERRSRSISDSTVSQVVPLSSSAPPSRKWSFTGLLESIGFLSSSVPSGIEDI